MLQTLSKKLEPWKAAAAALAVFVALPISGYAQTSSGAPPTGAPPFAPAGPVTDEPVSWAYGGPHNGGDGSARCPGPDEHGLFEAAIGSIFGHYDPSCHTPLGLDNFFEGWLTPWVPVGAGSSGALRGGWVNAPAGFFRREADLIYSFTQGAHGSPDEHLGQFNLFTPLSRRLEVGVFVPFVDSLDPGQGTFGDMVISSRVMLIETQDLGVTAGTTVRTPTGGTATGNGRTDVDPFAEVWADVGGAWQVRGGIDVDVPVENQLAGEPDAVLTASLALGKTFQGPLGEFTPYLATNFHQAFNGAGARDHAEYDLTPGIRAQLLKSDRLNSFLVWGLTFPVTGPRSFDTNNTFILVLGW